MDQFKKHKVEEKEYEDQVNWPVVIPILVVIAAMILYAFLF
ncbi:hypothetical protein PZB74_06875 [Porifericola rhodea]|nr:hypothetical protein [Porifericola rhodea]WKN33066.1 hypothetical protein PZB74_06875 [Porifericola rhodea]